MSILLARRGCRAALALATIVALWADWRMGEALATLPAGRWRRRHCAWHLSRCPPNLAVDFQAQEAALGGAAALRPASCASSDDEGLANFTTWPYALRQILSGAA